MADYIPDNTRVIDMKAFLRLREQEAGARKIAKELGVHVRTAQALMAGKHWQQNPAKVRAFNEVRGTALEAATGIPRAEDILAWGGLLTPSPAVKSQPQKDLRAALKAVGHGDHAGDIADRLTALQTGELAVPANLDTPMFLRMIQERLYQFLKLTTPDIMAKANLRDLTTATTAALNMMQLLKGEPTAIVRSDQRVGLDKVTMLLLAEAARRGVVVEAQKGVDYVEVNP